MYFFTIKKNFKKNNLKPNQTTFDLGIFMWQTIMFSNLMNFNEILSRISYFSCKGMQTEKKINSHLKRHGDAELAD